MKDTWTCQCKDCREVRKAMAKQARKTMTKNDWWEQAQRLRGLLADAAYRGDQGTVDVLRGQIRTIEEAGQTAPYYPGPIVVRSV